MAPRPASARWTPGPWPCEAGARAWRGASTGSCPASSRVSWTRSWPAGPNTGAGLRATTWTAWPRPCSPQRTGPNSPPAPASARPWPIPPGSSTSTWPSSSPAAKAPWLWSPRPPSVWRLGQPTRPWPSSTSIACWTPAPRSATSWRPSPAPRSSWTSISWTWPGPSRSGPSACTSWRGTRPRCWPPSSTGSRRGSCWPSWSGWRPICAAGAGAGR